MRCPVGDEMPGGMKCAVYKQYLSINIGYTTLLIVCICPLCHFVCVGMIGFTTPTSVNV